MIKNLQGEIVGIRFIPDEFFCFEKAEGTDIEGSIFLMSNFEKNKRV